MADIARFVGGLFPTAILFYLFNWLLRKFAIAPVIRVVTANGLSLAVATVASGYGHADDGSPDFFQGFLDYLLPQIVWLVVGLVALYGKNKDPLHIR